MLYRHIAVAVLAFFLTSPLAAHRRGDVLIETRGYHPATGVVGDRAIWVHIGWKFVYATAQPLIYKSIPYIGSLGRTFAPSPSLYVFHARNTVSWWDGKLQLSVARQVVRVF